MGHGADTRQLSLRWAVRGGNMFLATNASLGCVVENEAESGMTLTSQEVLVSPSNIHPGGL